MIKLWRNFDETLRIIWRHCFQRRPEASESERSDIVSIVMTSWHHRLQQLGTVASCIGNVKIGSRVLGAIFAGDGAWARSMGHEPRVVFCLRGEREGERERERERERKKEDYDTENEARSVLWRHNQSSWIKLNVRSLSEIYGPRSASLGGRREGELLNVLLQPYTAITSPCWSS